MGKSSKTTVDHLVKLLITSLVVLNVQVHGANFVKLTHVDSGVAKGAVCLNGSPPAFALDQGFGSGANNWVVFIEGGAWCNSTSDCVERSRTIFGDSYNRSRIYFEGILDSNQTFNPDFYNWNKVYVVYCDGASFMADIPEVDPANNLTFRGGRIFDAIMDELLARGMKNADNAILSGGSAGGLATILHCDKFRALLPNATRVKCISDSGFFIHGKDLPGAETIRVKRFADVIQVHKLAERLPKSCTSKMNPNLCLFPENLIEDIKTPIFILESAFDLFQVEQNYINAIGAPPNWSNCTANVTHCTSHEIKLMQDFRSTFITTLQNLNTCPSRGMFVHSCYLHGHLISKDRWGCSSVVGNTLANKTIREAISDWYFDRSSFQVIDTKDDVPRDCSSTLETNEFNFKCVKPQY